MEKTDARIRNACTTHYIMEPCPVDVIEQQAQNGTHHQVRYIIAGKETCPTTGRLHWQTYIQFKDKMSPDMIKNLFDDNTIHIEKQWARLDKCPLNYSKKEGEWKEWGTPKKQGERSDMPTMEELENIKTYEELQRSINFGTYIRYKRNIDEVWDNAQDNVLKRQFLQEIEQNELRPWQQHVLDNIPESRRKITWVWESTGNKGKSYLAEYMQLKMNALVTQTTNKADVVFAYHRHDYVIFDLARATWEPNYNTIEDFCNSSIFSGKYESKPKMCKSKVIVFSNSPPDTSRISGDRWNIIDINEMD